MSSAGSSFAMPPGRDCQSGGDASHFSSAMLLLDGARRVVQVNVSLLLLARRTRQDLLGQPLSKLLEVGQRGGGKGGARGGLWLVRRSSPDADGSVERLAVELTPQGMLDDLVVCAVREAEGGGAAVWPLSPAVDELTRGCAATGAGDAATGDAATGAAGDGDVGGDVDVERDMVRELKMASGGMRLRCVYASPSHERLLGREPNYLTSMRNHLR